MNGAAEVDAVTASDSNHTSNGCKKEENGELNLTSRQLELITQTWKLVDLEEAGMVMFMK